MTWTEEAQTRTETEPAFKQMELKAHELSGYAVSSNVLVHDVLCQAPLHSSEARNHHPVEDGAAGGKAT